MKKYLLIVVILSLRFYCEAQLNDIPLLVGKDKTEVVLYFDSLNSLKPNPKFKLRNSPSEKDPSSVGASFALEDQDFYKCLTVATWFYKEGDKEICRVQQISGSIKYFDVHQSYLKNNFTQVGENKWQKINDESLILLVIQDTTNSQYPLFSILYKKPKDSN